MTPRNDGGVLKEGVPMKSTLFAVCMLTCLAYGDFLDDFESYQPGESLESSGNWEREPTGGYALVAVQEGNQVAEAVFTDSTHIGYLCTAAGFWNDGSVAMDFSPDGTGSLANVLARMQITTGEAYVAGVVVFLQPFTYTYIGYINITGDYELLYSGFGPSLPPGAWVNLKLALEGDGPVTLTLYTDGQQTAQVVDSQYSLESGLSGFALLYEGSVPSVCCDDFQVLLGPQSMEAATFGAVKAHFLRQATR